MVFIIHEFWDENWVINNEAMINLQKIVNEVLFHNKKEGYSFNYEIVKKWCEDNNKMMIEHVIIPQMNHNYICDSIKTVFPEYITETYYKFPIGNYYYITDKGKRFTIRKKVRPYTKEEKERINEIKCEIRDVKQKKYMVERNSDISEYKKIYDIKKLKEQIDSLYDKLHDMSSEIETDRIKKTKYIITLCKNNKYTKIFFDNKYIHEFESNGYKVHKMPCNSKDFSMERNEKFDVKVMQWVDNNESNKDCYYIQMTHANFESCCKHGRIPKFGEILIEGKSVEYSSGRQKQKITLIDVNGNVHSYSSITRLAQDFDTTKGNVSKKLKNKSVGDKIKINGADFILSELS